MKKLSIRIDDFKKLRNNMYFVDKLLLIKEISGNIAYQNIETSDTTPWSFLLHSGYLRVIDKSQDTGHIK
ncbi:MAG: hypothetical protein U9N10_06690 [Bacillota bacterium]|nr:hypothetical protein [Bacillota bacterium]